jgi:hypothetical protein
MISIFYLSSISISINHLSLISIYLYLSIIYHWYLSFIYLSLISIIYLSIIYVYHLSINLSFIYLWYLSFINLSFISIYLSVIYLSIYQPIICLSICHLFGNSHSWNAHIHPKREVFCVTGCAWTELGQILADWSSSFLCYSRFSAEMYEVPVYSFLLTLCCGLDIKYPPPKAHALKAWFPEGGSDHREVTDSWDSDLINELIPWRIHNTIASEGGGGRWW